MKVRLTLLHAREAPCSRTPRAAILLCLLAAVPMAAPGASAAPAAGPPRTVSFPVPRTRAATIRPAPGLRTRLAWPATHVGFTWAGGDDSRLLYRTWGEEGATSWRGVPESYDMEQAGTHYSAMLSIDRPSSIEWRAGEGDAGVSGVALHLLNTVDGPRREVEAPVAGATGRGVPDIVTRAEWGADESIKRTTGNCERSFWPARQLFVHHTAGSNNDPHPMATMRAIYHYHTVTRGWCDIGYTFVIAPDGRLFEGRWARPYAPWEVHTGETVDGRVVTGAHVENFNSGSVGVSLMGNLSATSISRAARRSLVGLLAWEAGRRDLHPRAMHTYRNPDTGLTRRLHVIAGHRDAGQTECPGNHLYDILPGLRRRVAAVIGDGRRTSHLALDTQDRIVFGHAVRVTGRLTTDAGRGLRGRGVTVYRRSPGTSWARGSRVRTGGDGGLGLRFTPASNRSLRAVYRGGRRVWGSQSRTTRVLVAPRIALTPAGGHVAPDGVRHFSAGTTHVSVSGAVKPAHPKEGRVAISVERFRSGGNWRELSRASKRLTSESRYSASMAVAGPGKYRVVTRMAADDDHAAGRSPVRGFVVDAP